MDTPIVISGTVGLVAGSLLSVAIAQKSMFDPAIVAPHIYETTLENDRVRVLSVTTRNGETASLHSHPDRVVVYLSSCAWMESTDDGKTQMESYTAGDVVWAERETHGGDTSNVVHDCNSLEIELKE
jgi:hypothetical protein